MTKAELEQKLRLVEVKLMLTETTLSECIRIMDMNVDGYNKHLSAWSNKHFEIGEDFYPYMAGEIQSRLNWLLRDLQRKDPS